MPCNTRLVEIAAQESQKLLEEIDLFPATSLPSPPQVELTTLFPCRETAPTISPLGRPKLDPPKEPISRQGSREMRMIQALDESRSISDALIFEFANSLENYKNQIKTLSLENIEKLNEAAMRAQESALWTLLKKIGSCLVSALSIFIGGSLIASGAGALAGGAMIASGVVSLTNLACTEFGVWNWLSKKLNDNEEKQHQIATLTPMVIGIGCGLVSLGAGIGGALTTGIDLLDKSIFIAQGLLSFFQAGTSFGDGYANFRLLNARADLSHTRTYLAVEQDTADLFTNNLSDIIKSISHSSELANQVLSLSLEAHQIANQELQG